MDKNQALLIDDLKGIILGDFLAPDISTFDETETANDNSIQYKCQNHVCANQNITMFNIFQIDDDDNIVVICDNCYNLGFRFCLFTNEVIHQDQMVNVWGDMYVQPEYNQDRLNPNILNNITDLHKYLHIIGIDNPNPEHNIINVITN